MHGPGFDAGVLQQPTAGGVIVAGALSIGEREALFSWLAEDRLVSWSVLAARLGRHRITVAREVARNGGRVGYSPFRAQQRAGRML